MLGAPTTSAGLPSGVIPGLLVAVLVRVGVLGPVPTVFVAVAVTVGVWVLTTHEPWSGLGTQLEFAWKVPPVHPEQLESLPLRHT